MSIPVRASDRDLRALAAIVTEDRADLPDGEGLAPSLLADLMGHILCDALSLDSWDSGRQTVWFSQEIPSGDARIGFEGQDEVYWQNHPDCQPCSYTARTGDQRSVITISDFYSARQWHSTGMYTDFYRPTGMEHSLMVCLPSALPPTAGPGRYVRLTLQRGPGPDFHRAGPGGTHPAGPAPGPGLPGCPAAPPSRPPADPPADRPAAPGSRRAHQHPDRPAARHLRGNRTHPPGKHLRQAAGHQPHRRGRPRLPRPRGVGPASRRLGRFDLCETLRRPGARSLTSLNTQHSRRSADADM